MLLNHLTKSNDQYIERLYVFKPQKPSPLSE